MLQALGFNTVKLPFSFEVLHGTSYGSYSRWDGSPTPSACNLTNPSRQAVVDNAIQSVNFLGIDVHIGTVPLPGQPGLMEDATICNKYVPYTLNTLDRFNWVINFLAENGMYVVSALLHLTFLWTMHLQKLKALLFDAWQTFGSLCIARFNASTVVCLEFQEPVLWCSLFRHMSAHLVHSDQLDHYEDSHWLGPFASGVWFGKWRFSSLPPPSLVACASPSPSTKVQ